MRRAVPDPPRIRSQAFSTSQRFLQSQFPWPCFMPQPFAGTLLQSLPLEEIAVSSRIRQLPRLSTRVPCALPPTCSRSISPTPTLLTQLPGSQRTLRKPIHRNPKVTDPGHPAPGAAEPQRSASFTRFAALLPLRVRSRQPRLPSTNGRYSPGRSSPLEPSPPQPRNLEPTPAQGWNTNRSLSASSRDPQDLAALPAG
jgi:hypothetical protein